MLDDETFILSPRDPASIVKLQDPSVIEQLLENPPAVLAELLAGWFATGNGATKDLAMATRDEASSLQTRGW